jgi:sarcosine oxidase subunit delta
LTSTAPPLWRIESEYNMLLIECPYCGVRAETEFAYGGEGGIARPLQTETLSDEQWGDYLFMRKNPKGMHHEQWRHASGCGRWFNALRDTVSYRFEAVWKIGEPAPTAHSARTAKEPT